MYNIYFFQKVTSFYLQANVTIASVPCMNQWFLACTTNERYMKRSYLNEYYTKYSS